ncbi:MAG: hypothetical protein IPO35_09900 [Uliginosibacterium sp.]|jgi:hypothetical protein|nr:hypothetical protein [Uliginosibacterium sp.]MBK9615801.1 hypothetical protein [Uliginosibacterium sp.]
MTRFRLLFGLLLVLFSSVAGAGCFLIFCSLDTEGTGPGWSCQPDWLQAHYFNKTEHRYVFSSACSVTHGEYASNFVIDTTGTWKPDGTAIQKSVASNPAFTATITAKCKSDPWLTDTVCTDTKVRYSVASAGETQAMRMVYGSQLKEYTTEPFPMTASRLDAQDKAELAKTHAASHLVDRLRPKKLKIQP